MESLSKDLKQASLIVRDNGTYQLAVGQLQPAALDGAPPLRAINVSTRTLSTNGTGNAVTSISNGQTTNTWALYTQNDIHLSNRVTVTLGARYTEESAWRRF